MLIRRLAFVCAVMGFTALAGNAQLPGGPAEEQMRAGIKAINSGNLAAAREPLEKALALAPDDAYRLKVHRNLLIPYRELPDIGPMQQSAEFIISHSTQSAERSVHRSNLLSFIHRRGKMEDAVKGYEERLKKTPDDTTVLYILTDAYATFTKNPTKSIETAEKIIALDKKQNKEPDLTFQANLAQQYVKAGKQKEGATLYETIAGKDPRLAAWNYKEAATAWLAAGDKTKALAAAKKSTEVQPESRGEQLKYFWHRGLADVFFDAGDPKSAIPHYEQAITLTKIAGYKKDSQDRLEKARAAAK